MANAKNINITCISDLHGFFLYDLPGGDLLIIAGDLTARDDPEEYLEFNTWLSNQDYQRKIVIAGNHDGCCEKGIDVEVNPGQIEKIVPVLADKAIYLCDSVTEFEDLKIWGSPWTKWFPECNPKCQAFMLKTEEDLAEKWAMIPDDIDILITHSPPYGIFDLTINDELAGSYSLFDKVFFHQNLQLHVFGHIHENGGQVNHRTKSAKDNYISVNASIVNEKYQHVNKPVRIEL